MTGNGMDRLLPRPASLRGLAAVNRRSKLMKPKKEFSAGSLAAIGVDIGKEVFHIVGLGIDGKIAFRKKVRRFGFEDAFEKLPLSIVGMEACLSAHFVS